MNKEKSVSKFVIKMMSILFGISVTIAVIVSIGMKYYEAIGLIIFLGIYIYLFLYGVIMVLTPLKPANEEEIIEYRKKDAQERKNIIEEWWLSWCILMVIIIGIGIGITVDTVGHKEIVEIEQSRYIKNVEKHSNRTVTWYDVYEVKYQYGGKECTDVVRFDEIFEPWTIKAVHSYVYADKHGAEPFWDSFFTRIFFDDLALLFTGFLITYFINIERTISVAGELELEEERLAEKKARKLNYLSLSFAIIVFLYLLIMLCIHFYPVFVLEF